MHILYEGEEAEKKSNELPGSTRYAKQAPGTEHSALERSTLSDCSCPPGRTEVVFF